jgi:transcriptional regulator with XRE-family HTH domain
MIVQNMQKPEEGYRKIVGQKIREFRERKGFSQNHLAAMMDVNRSTISKIENGKFAISIDYLAKFSRFLEFDILLTKNRV